jgi:hypothetical protein
MRHATLVLSRFGVAVAASLILAPPAHAGNLDPNPDVERLAAQAKWLQLQAGWCEGMTCRSCDCADMARTTQALVDAETALIALHRALMEQDALLRDVHHHATSNSLLTGTALAQLQFSLACQEFAHKLGSYLLKIASIMNTLEGIKEIPSEGAVKGIPAHRFVIDGNKSALEAIEKLDSLGNLLKNTADLVVDETAVLDGYIHDNPQLVSPLKGQLNTAWDWKSEGVDVLKLARDARKAYLAAPKEGLPGWTNVRKELLETTKLRNVLGAVGRALKMYSEKQLASEKAAEKEMRSYEGPEAAFITSSYKDWQRARARKLAAEEALTAVRTARQLLAGAMNATECGAVSLTRTPLGPFGDGKYGAVLKALDPMLPDIAARLDGDIHLADPDAPPAPMPPTKHAVGNQCGKCSALEPELARTLDQMDFTGQELHRIRADLEQAVEIEKSAAISRDAVKRISALIMDFRYGKKARNTLLAVGDALFRGLNRPHEEINLVSLERTKREYQNELSTQEARMVALRSEQDQIRPLEKEQMRLYEAGEKLKVKISVCSSEVPADLTGTWTDRNSCGEYDITQSGRQVSLTHAGYSFSGTVKMDRIDLFHVLTFEETSASLPDPIRKQVVGEKVEISGDTSDDCRGIDAVFIKNHPHWKEKEGKYWIESQEVRTKKLRLRKVAKPGR